MTAGDLVKSLLEKFFPTANGGQAVIFPDAEDALFEGSDLANFSAFGASHRFTHTTASAEIATKEQLGLEDNCVIALLPSFPTSSFRITRERIHGVAVLAVVSQPRCVAPASRSRLSSRAIFACGVVWCGVVWCGMHLLGAARTSSHSRHEATLPTLHGYSRRSCLACASTRSRTSRAQTTD